MRYFTVQYPVAPIPWKPAINALASNRPRPMTSGRIRIDEGEEGADGDDITAIRLPARVHPFKVDSPCPWRSPARWWTRSESQVVGGYFMLIWPTVPTTSVS